MKNQLQTFFSSIYMPDVVMIALFQMLVGMPFVLTLTKRVYVSPAQEFLSEILMGACMVLLALDVYKTKSEGESLSVYGEYLPELAIGLVLGTVLFGYISIFAG